MASSMVSDPTVGSMAALHRIAHLPGPPPTPTSLMDLPKPWLLQLAKSSALDWEADTVLALFRTCAFFRDAVARHRTAEASFHVPIAAEDFPTELQRLCSVAKRSGKMRLVFWGEETFDGRPVHRWTDTEPHITHLLVCAMGQLEGERPLACVKEVLISVSG